MLNIYLKKNGGILRGVLKYATIYFYAFSDFC